MLNCNIGVSAKNCFWKELVKFAENYCLQPSLQAPARVCGEGVSPAPAQFRLGDLTPFPLPPPKKGGKKKKRKEIWD